MAASTRLRLLKPCLLSLHEQLGGITQIFAQRDVDTEPFLDFWGPYSKLCRLGGRVRVVMNEAHMSVFHSA